MRPRKPENPLPIPLKFATLNGKAPFSGPMKSTQNQGRNKLPIPRANANPGTFSHHRVIGSLHFCSLALGGYVHSSHWWYGLLGAGPYRCLQIGPRGSYEEGLGEQAISMRRREWNTSFLGDMTRLVATQSFLRLLKSRSRKGLQSGQRGPASFSLASSFSTLGPWESFFDEKEMYMCCTSGNKSFQNWKKASRKVFVLPSALLLCRYSSWTASALAKKVEEGKANLEEIEAYALGASEPKTSSGKQDSGEMGDEPCTLAQSIWALWIDLWNR